VSLFNQLRIQPKHIPIPDDIGYRLRKYLEDNRTIIDDSLKDFYGFQPAQSEVVTHTFTGAVEEAITHHLDRIPDYFFADVNKNSVIYRGGTAWTKSTIYLIDGANAGTTANIWIF
jgi:hypothetical protein